MSATFSGIASLSTVVGLIVDTQGEIEGDLNFDGCVDREDYFILMSSIRGDEPFDPAFDLNEDGAVNRADARTLVGLFTNSRGVTCP